MNPTSLMLFVLWGWILVFALAWLYAFFMISASTLQGMISSGVFNLRSLGWSAFCAILALIPLWIALLVWANFRAASPA